MMLFRCPAVPLTIKIRVRAHAHRNGGRRCQTLPPGCSRPQAVIEPMCTPQPGLPHTRHSQRVFASNASAKSDWVDFEIDRARLRLIQRRGFRLLVFPVDSEVRHADLPGWVQEHWIERAGYSPRDVARYIRNVVEAIALAGMKS